LNWKLQQVSRDEAREIVHGKLALLSLWAVVGGSICCATIDGFRVFRYRGVSRRCGRRPGHRRPRLVFRSLLRNRLSWVGIEVIWSNFKLSEGSNAEEQTGKRDQV